MAVEKFALRFMGYRSAGALAQLEADPSIQEIFSVDACDGLTAFSLTKERAMALTIDQIASAVELILDKGSIPASLIAVQPRAAREEISVLTMCDQGVLVEAPEGELTPVRDAIERYLS